MTAQERYTGRHRATTVPSNWGRPDGRRHLNGTPGFDWATATVPELPPYRLPPPTTPAFPPPGELPADGWSEAMVPADADTTGTFSLAELGAATGATLLPAALAGPDPEPVQIDAWTGPLPIVAAERTETASVWRDGLLAAFAFLMLVALVWATVATNAGRA